jgi:outer membrane protein assembly factor BamB
VTLSSVTTNDTSFHLRRRRWHGLAALATLAVAFSATLSACGSRPAADGIPTVRTIPPRTPTGPTPPPLSSEETAWTEALHDARHSGQASVVGLQTGALRWNRALGAPIAGGPAIAPDGTIYAFNNTGIFHAIDPTTGTDKWTFQGQGSSDSSQDLSTTPAILSDGTVLWPGPGSKLYALNSSGQLQWTLPLRGTVLSPAVTASGRVYVSDTDGDVVALMPRPSFAGRLWTIALGKTSFESPAVGPNGTIYVTPGNSLFAIRDEGTKASIAWKFTTRSEIEVSASVAANATIVLGTNDAYEYGLTPQGTQLSCSDGPRLRCPPSGNSCKQMVRRREVEDTKNPWSNIGRRPGTRRFR